MKSWLFIIMLAQVLAYGAQAQPPAPASIYDERLNDLEREAIEIAYKNYVAQLFESWMRDPASQPWRAVEGTKKARRAYIEVMTALDAKEFPK